MNEFTAVFIVSKDKAANQNTPLLLTNKKHTQQIKPRCFVLANHQIAVKNIYPLFNKQSTINNTHTIQYMKFFTRNKMWQTMRWQTAGTNDYQ